MDQTSEARTASPWETQLRVIGALLMREILTRFGRHNLGFLWLFLEPMMFTMGILALWTFAKFVHSSFPIAAFALTGYSSVLLWRNMPNRCIGAIAPNQQLMYHRNVTILDIYLSRIILEGFGASASFLILSMIFIFFGVIKPPEDMLKVLLGWGMIAWFGCSLALMLAALAVHSETVERVWHVLTYLMFPLSGAAFNVDALPKEGQKYILLLPMVHGVELVREGYFGSAFKAHYDLVYLSVISGIMMLAGLILIKELQRNRSPE